MRELAGGWINKVELAEGIVIKEFIDNGVEKSADERWQTEAWALENMPYSPLLYWVGERKIAMQYLAGERFLDRDIREMLEAQQYKLLRQFGQTLRGIHEQHSYKPLNYNQRVVQETLSWLDKVREMLAGEGINVANLLEYVEQENRPQERLVVTHGDYWLNNFIAEYWGERFTLNGVIDWEMGRVASPYEDFALVELSTERAYGGIAQAVWKGYGQEPDRRLQRWYSIRKALEWMAGEDFLNLSSEFYQDKVKLIKETI